MSEKDSAKKQTRLLLQDKLNSLVVTEEMKRNLEQNLLQFLSKQKGIWAAFRSIKNEPDVYPCLAKSPLRWAYPVTRAEQVSLRFILPEQNQFVAGYAGILEPVEGQEIQINELSGILVPGLGFDRNGNRLGRGKGFYDRILGATTALKIGVAWEAQVIQQVPIQPHDVLLDGLITEAGVVKWKS